MQGRRAFTYSLTVAISLAAVLTTLTVAGDCDAADWLQTIALTGLPLTAAVGAGSAAFAWGRRVVVSIGAGLLVGVATWVTAVLLWAGSCSA